MSVEYLKHSDGSYYDLEKDGIDKPLWWHLKGLQQTATGYGRKLSTSKMVKYNNRLHRVYCCIFSNIGTCYIISKGKWLVIW